MTVGEMTKDMWWLFFDGWLIGVASASLYRTIRDYVLGK